jgi:hypothetical protein
LLPDFLRCNDNVRKILQNANGWERLYSSTFAADGTLAGIEKSVGGKRVASVAAAA